MSILSDVGIRQLCENVDYNHYIVDQAHETSAHHDSNLSHIKSVIVDHVFVEKRMIEPFIPELIRTNAQGHRIISYGLTSYGYDVRIQNKVKLFTNINSSIIDPMRPDESCFVDGQIRTDEQGNSYFILPPNSYALTVTVEYFTMPNNLMVIVLGKSTYARSGIQINCTPVEAGFEGNIVIEISNGSNLPVKVYTEMGIAQFLFFIGDRPCDTSYADRNGKYQGQQGIVFSKV